MLYLFEVIVEVPAIESSGRERTLLSGGFVHVVDVDVGVVDDDGLGDGWDEGWFYL